MKSYPKLFAYLLILLITIHVNAQSKSTQTTVCNIMQQDQSANVSKDAPLVLYLQDSASNKKLAIVFAQTIIKKMSYDPQAKLVNQKVCVSGIVKSYNNQPAIFINSEKQIKVADRASIEKNNSNSGG